MKNLKDTLLEFGFSNELIDAISTTPRLESQENNVADTRYQTFESNMTSSTEINMSENPNTYNYYGNEVANPGNYQTNFDDLQRATGVVRDLQTLKPSYWRTGNAPFSGDLTVLPTKNNPRYVPVNGVYKNPVYFDGSYVPDLAQFYELTEGPRVNIWGPSTPRVNQACNPQY